MKHLLLAVVLCGLPTPAWAYIDTAPTLGKIINDSTNIVVLRIEKVHKEKKALLFKKVADLKGTHPTREIRHQLSDGPHPRELKTILDWAEPGRIALWFRDAHSSATCIGPLWYQSAPRPAPWWTMTRVCPDFSCAYAGSVAKLREHVRALLAGKEVIITALANAAVPPGTYDWRFVIYFRASLRDVPLCRFRASLKMPDFRTQVLKDPRYFVGPGAGGGEDVPALINMLRHADAFPRAEAAEDLGRVVPPAKEALPALVKALKDSDGLVRLRAAVALARIEPGHRDALPAALRELKVDAARLRSAAATALGDLATEAAVPALAEALKDADGSVRWAAAESLGRLGSRAKGAVPALRAALRDPAIRGMAADALGAIGPTAKEAGPSLSVMIRREKDRQFRLVAGIALVRIDPTACTAAAPVFAEAIRDHYAADQDILNIIELMRPGQMREAVPILIAMLQEKDSGVQLWAAALLGHPEYGAAVPALSGWLKGNEGRDYAVCNVRRHVIQSLGMIGAAAKPTVSLIAAYLKDADVETRIRAAEALWILSRDRSVVSVLTEAFQGKDALTRQFAANALMQMEGEAKAAVPLLTTSLKHADWAVRICAARTLWRISRDANVVPVLTEALQDKQLRSFAGEALGEIGPEAQAAVPALLNLLKGKDENVRTMAAWVLKRIDPEAAAKAGNR